MFGGIRSFGSKIVDRVENFATSSTVRDLGQFAARRLILGDAAGPLFPDAAKVTLSNQALRRVASVTDIPLVEKLAGVEGGFDKEPVPTDSIFYPGATVSGDFGRGYFSTEEGLGGTYEKLPGGQVKFRIDGFSGYIIPGGKAFAYNAETGETYKMQIEAKDGKYSFTEIEQFKGDEFIPSSDDQPLIDEGKALNVDFRYGKDGLFNVEVRDNSGAIEYSGRGFLDRRGHYLLALSNGTTIEGNYSVGEDGNLQIYSRKLLQADK